MALPTSLLASIRLRLATVLESDAAVHLLLQLSAVMGGACSLTAVQACLLAHPAEYARPGASGV